MSSWVGNPGRQPYVTLGGSAGRNKQKSETRLGGSQMTISFLPVARPTWKWLLLLLLHAGLRKCRVRRISPDVNGLWEDEVGHGVGGHVLLVVGHGLAKALGLRQKARGTGPGQPR